MPNMVIPDEGKGRLALWAFITENSSFGSLRLQLYQNNYTPVDSSVLANFTLATFTGADPITIEREDWTGPSIESNIAYVYREPAPEWTMTAGSDQTVYGWVLWDNSDSCVIAAQLFSVARMMSIGATEVLDPFRIALKTLD